MIFTSRITTSSGTLETAPTKTNVKLTKGLVYRVEIDFPPGSSGLMGVWIQHGAHQVWPFKPKEYFSGDNIQIAFDDTYMLSSEPFLLSVYTFNIDTQYDHLVNVRIGLVSERIFIARYLPSLSAEMLAEAIEAVASRQKKMEIESSRKRYDELLEWMSGQGEGEEE